MPRHSNTHPGWIRNEFKEIRRLIRESNAAKRLQAATIGAGGITVKDAGLIRVLHTTGEDGITIGPYGAQYGLGGTSINMTDADPESRKTFAVDNIVFSSDEFPPLWNFLFRGDRVTVDSNVVNIGSGGDDGGQVYMENGVGLFLTHPMGVAINHTTTAAAANCYIDPVSWRIYRVSSSRRYKRDITEAEVDVDAVLALVPRAFRRKDEVEELGDDAPTYVGFVAEEAADLGLDAWVTSDDEGPESFSYSQWGVAQQAVLRAQQDRINDLERRLAALEERP